MASSLFAGHEVVVGLVFGSFEAPSCAFAVTKYDVYDHEMKAEVLPLIYNSL